MHMVMDAFHIHVLECIHCQSACECAVHFSSDAHLQIDMAVIVIDYISSQDSCLRKIRESRRIRSLGTLFPLGTNLKVNSLRSLVVQLPFKLLHVLPNNEENCLGCKPGQEN